MDLEEKPSELRHNAVGSQLVRIWIKKFHLNPRLDFGIFYIHNLLWFGMIRTARVKKIYVSRKF